MRALGWTDADIPVWRTNLYAAGDSRSAADRPNAYSVHFKTIEHMGWRAY